MARQVYQPWFKQIGAKWRLRKLKGCAQNDRTRRAMNRIQRNVAKGRFGQIAYYHSLTPFVMGEPGFERSAIPPPCVYRETRGTYGAQRWTAENPDSGADGPYQLLDHGQPDAPVQGIKAKMAHHEIAHDLYADYGLEPWGGSC